MTLTTSRAENTQFPLPSSRWLQFVVQKLLPTRDFDACGLARLKR